MGVIRLGLVGAGRWGRIYIRTLSSLAQTSPAQSSPDGIRLAAVASRNPETAALAGPDCAIFPDWRAMLDMDGLDGVIVATPPGSHAEIAMACLARDLAVLVEKPLSMDPAEALSVRHAAQKTGRPVLVDHVHLYAPAWRGLKAALPGIGAIRALRGVAGNHGPYRTDASVLWDWGPHDLSMMLDLLGVAPDSASARLAERRPVADGVGETVELTLRFGTVTASAVMGTLMDKTRRFTVYGERGTLVYDDLAPAKLVRLPVLNPDDPLPSGGEAIAIAADPPLSCCVRAFADAIAAGQTNSPDLDLGVRVVEILDSCIRTTPSLAIG